MKILWSDFTIKLLKDGTYCWFVQNNKQFAFRMRVDNDFEFFFHYSLGVPFVVQKLQLAC